MTNPQQVPVFVAALVKALFPHILEQQPQPMAHFDPGILSPIPTEHAFPLAAVHADPEAQVGAAYVPTVYADLQQQDWVL